MSFISVSEINWHGPVGGGGSGGGGITPEMTSRKYVHAGLYVMLGRTSQKPFCSDALKQGPVLLLHRSLGKGACASLLKSSPDRTWVWARESKQRAERIEAAATCMQPARAVEVKLDARKTHSKK